SSVSRFAMAKALTLGVASAAIRMLVGFFFFQAEDGIRDRTVTGVQTCALPIFARGACGRGSMPASAPVDRPSAHSEGRWCWRRADRKSTRLNSSHRTISYAVFCLKKKKNLTHLLVG